MALTCEIGQKFGYWEIVDNNYISKSGSRYVKCRCKCGKIQEIRLSDLYNGRATGCRNCKARERSKEVHIGDKFKHWTVVDGPIVRNKSVMWFVQCDCGQGNRWIQTNELVNPNKCFSCQKFACKYSAQEITLVNGRIGELTKTRYGKLKKNAEVREITFEVTIDYLWNLYEQQNHCCAITGDLLKSIDDASLDRIDSSKGYIEGNVQWVTKQANLSKHIMSMDELYEFCQKVLNHANQQPSTSLTTCEGSETNS